MINNLEAYKVFYYVAKCGSVTKAAGELSISQPAVSQAIKQLENTLDAALFHRAAKGVRLTSEGELLYSYVAKGYEQIEMGVKKVHQMQNMELGEVRIGASDMTLQFYLLPYLEKFHEQYPGIKVIVTNAPTPETLNYLREGHIDFGIVSTPFPERPDIQMIPVREIEDVFVAGRRFFSYKNRTLDFQKLESLPLIFLEKNTSSRSYMDEFLAGNGVYVQPEFELRLHIYPVSRQKFIHVAAAAGIFLQENKRQTFQFLKIQRPVLVAEKSSSRHEDILNLPHRYHLNIRSLRKRRTDNSEVNVSLS